MPDSTNEAFYEPLDILGVNDIFKPLILRLGSSNAAQPTVKHGVHLNFVVPPDYVNSAVWRIYWTSSLVAGDAVFFCDYRSIAGNDLNSIDQATFEQQQTVTDTAPGAAFRQLTTSITPTAGNFAAGENIFLYFGRDGAAAGDTLAGSAIVFGLDFEYSDA